MSIASTHFCRTSSKKRRLPSGNRTPRALIDKWLGTWGTFSSSADEKVAPSSLNSQVRAMPVLKFGVNPCSNKTIRPSSSSLKTHIPRSSDALSRETDWPSSVAPAFFHPHKTRMASADEITFCLFARRFGFDVAVDLANAFDLRCDRPFAASNGNS